MRSVSEDLSRPPRQSGPDVGSEPITVDWTYTTEPLTVTEIEGLAEAIRAVDTNTPVTPLTHPDSDADPAELEPSSRGSMGVLAETIEIVVPIANFAGLQAAGAVAVRIANAAVDWLRRKRQRELGNGGIVEVKVIFGPGGEVLSRVEVPSEDVGEQYRRLGPKT